MVDTPKIIIRPTRPDDVPEVTAIYAVEVATGRASFELEPPGEDEMLRRYRRAVDGGHPHLVACRSNAVLGYAYSSEYRSRPGYRFTVEDSVYVKGEARGAGVGRALLAALIEECQGRPFRQMIAIIGDSGNVASIALHAALGFREVGVLRDVGFKFDTWIDTVIMQRAL